MKKLSDYRIREENGKFYIELMVEEIEKPFLKKRTKNIKWVPTDVDGDRIIRYNGRYLYEPCNAFNTLKEAKVQIIQWCEDPKYHYVVPVMREMPSWAKQEFITQQVPQMNIPYSVAMEATTRDVNACKKQFNEKLPSFKDCGYKSLCTLPLTVEEKNLELQLENAKLKGIIETLTAKKK